MTAIVLTVVMMIIMIQLVQSKPSGKKNVNDRDSLKTNPLF